MRWLPQRHIPRVVVYTRHGCGLCAQAERMVAKEARRAAIEHVDVDTSEDLVVRYGVRVPVVTVDGVEVAELELAAGVVRSAVRSAIRRPALGAGGRAT